MNKVGFGRRMVPLLSVVVVACGLAGCIDIPIAKDQPPRLYVLTPKSTYPAELKPVDWQLLIDAPVSPGSTVCTIFTSGASALTPAPSARTW